MFKLLSSLQRRNQPPRPCPSTSPSFTRRASVGGVPALRDNAFEAKLAGMGEDGRAVAFDVFVEPDAGAGFGHDRCERGLANLQRIAPQVVAVQFDQVEGVQERAVIMAAVANEIERGNAVVIAGDSFAVDDASRGAASPTFTALTLDGQAIISPDCVSARTDKK
jgi:hypothetical protein